MQPQVQTKMLIPTQMQEPAQSYLSLPQNCSALSVALRSEAEQHPQSQPSVSPGSPPSQYPARYTPAAFHPYTAVSQSVSLEPQPPSPANAIMQCQQTEYKQSHILDHNNSRKLRNGTEGSQEPGLGTILGESQQDRSRFEELREL